MKKSVVAIVITVVLILIVSGFYFVNLGGLDEIEYDHVVDNKIVVYGKSFKGKYNSKELEKLFYEIKTMVDKSPEKGMLTVVNYRLDTESEKDGLVHQLVGVSFDSEAAAVPGLEKTIFEEKDVVRATIGAHNFVMPKPENVRAGALEVADSLGRQLKLYTIEQYASDRALVVLFPLD